MLIQVLIENVLGQVDIFRDMFFETSEICQRVIMYPIEHISHDTHLDFLC